MDDKLTIVGPEPSGGTPPAPARVNIEALLLMAKYDDGFRELLLSDRQRALGESGISFSNAEKLLLASVSAEKLAVSIGEFSINGVTRESLPSWKEAAAIILLIMTMLVGPSCRSGQDAPVVKGIVPDRRPKACVELRAEDVENFSDGWCDPDTFRILARGEPPKNETDIEKRKMKARDTAVLYAKYLILEKFVGSRIEAGGLVSDEYQNPGLDAIKAKAKELFKNGEVVAQKWDSTQVCTVVYQVHRPGLRRWIQSE